MAAKNSTPVTMEARPVRAPSATPEADSTKEVLDDTPPRPPATAASESTVRICCRWGGLPFSFSRPPS